MFLQFELLPTVDLMLGLYSQPRSPERFQNYLKLLQGDSKGDLVLPIGNFNPMAKEHVVEKLQELKIMKAEQLIAKTLSDLNKTTTSSKENSVFKVALNVADDLHGGWTNKYTVDYDSKFKFNALFERQFCVPILFASETFTEELIIQRTKEYCFRSVNWLTHPKPKTLKQHVDQEAFVATWDKHFEMLSKEIFQKLDSFYNLHQNTDRYDVIFNFFYGDTVCKTLNFPLHNVEKDFGGFKYACNLTI